MGKVGAVWCRMMRGHDLIVVREGARIYSECLHCGHTTCGWDLEATPKVGSPVHAWGRQDFKEAYAELWEAELEVHGGG